MIKKLIKKKKFWIIISTVVVALTIGGISFSKMNASDKGMMVTTAPIEKQDISATIRVKGELKSKVRSEISSDLKYKIKDIFVKEGDVVKAGDVLATLDMEDLNYEIKDARLDLEISEAQYNEKNSEDNIFSLRKILEGKNIDLETAKHKYETSKALHETGNVSKDDFDNDFNEYKKAKNEVEIANENLNVALRNKNNNSDLKVLEQKRINLQRKIDDLSKSTIKSSIDGTVTAVNAKIGSIAEGTAGLFVVEDTKNLQAKFDVNEFDVKKLHMGQEITLTTESLADKSFKGKITNIYPSAQTKDSNSGKQIIIPAIVDLVGNVEGLRPGLVIESNVEVEKEKEAFVLPYEAIYEKQDKTNAIFLVKEGVLKEVPVKLGVEGDLAVQVISKDIKKGDIVALNPDESFATGMKVVTDIPDGNKDGKKGK